MDDEELLRIARFLNVSAEGLCKLSVIFVREGLTDEICYNKFTERARAAVENLDAQLDAFGGF